MVEVVEVMVVRGAAVVAEVMIALEAGEAMVALVVAGAMVDRGETAFAPEVAVLLLEVVIEPQLALVAAG